MFNWLINEIRYHIAANFGEVFNLANWQFCRKSPDLKPTNNIMISYTIALCRSTRDHQIKKLPMTDSPNLMLAKVSRYTVVRVDFSSLIGAVFAEFKSSCSQNLKLKHTFVWYPLVMFVFLDQSSPPLVSWWRPPHQPLWEWWMAQLPSKIGTWLVRTKALMES